MQDPPIHIGPWSAQEDACLLKLVAEHGAHSWPVIALHMPGRNNDQCRRRYCDYLDPSIKQVRHMPCVNGEGRACVGSAGAYLAQA